MLYNSRTNEQTLITENKKNTMENKGAFTEVARAYGKDITTLCLKKVPTFELSVNLNF